MNQTLEHRGPDDDGFYLSGPVGLAMRRLSIIDLVGGSQPIANEDKSAWIVCNGEIYNYLDIRRDLETRGHVFNTDTDTETIVHLYEEYGEDCVQHLNGMFAFAIWDDRRQRLVLARDRLGIKPLYYYVDRQRLVFGSELKALMACPDVPRELDLTALDLYLSFSYVPAPFSIFQDVRKLPAGHTLTCEGGQVQVRQYWDVSFLQDDNQPEDVLAEELLELLTDSVRIRLRSDVPLGAFLSGGVDSSTVVALMSRLADQPVKTFSIGFREAYYDETKYARLVADRYATEHQEFVVGPNVLLDALDQYAWHFDEPFADWAALPTYLLSRMTREHVTVALTGDGGDEVFAGYNRYWTERAMQYYGHVPQVLRESVILPILEGLGSVVPFEMRLKEYLASAAKRTRLQSLPSADRYELQFTPFGPEMRHSLYAPQVCSQVPPRPAEAYQSRFEETMGYHWLSRAQYVDLKTYLPEQMLTKVDRMSMAVGLEARVPLLDHRIVEFSARVPPRYLMSWRLLKRFFKRSVRDLVPAPILNRPKHGFQVPLGRWFRNELRDLAQDSLAPAELRKHALFDASMVSGILEQHLSGERNNEAQIFALLVFQMWWNRFMSGDTFSGRGTA